ncbi:MAG TPA: ABC transporter substrate-binding protein [Stellaceae bacterium]|nr:ABC transporter substrate-binding protein [Stellaceae bacterium]
MTAGAAHAEKKYGPGVSDTEVKIGQTMPYSGPASAYGAVGLAEIAYYKMINEQGGVNGRKITLLSLDDGYSPPKTVEQTRKLVEDDQVLAIVGALGTAANTAIQKYLNVKSVPQIFISTGATKWADPQHFPWTMGWQPNYQTEGKIDAKYALQNVAAPKIAILYQNDDYGKDYVEGFKKGLGDKVNLIVKEVSYEVTDPTVDSQIVTLQGSGANVFFNVTTPKFAAQSIRRVYDIGWKPLHLLNNVGASIGSVLKPAGFEKSIGIITVAYQKSVADPTWDNDKGMQDYLAFMKKYMPQADPTDGSYGSGYNIAMNFSLLLKQCGDDLTRENLMRQMANMHDIELPMLLPGIKVNTSPTNFSPIQQEQLARFDGKSFVRFGEVLSAGGI